MNDYKTSDMQGRKRPSSSIRSKRKLFITMPGTTRATPNLTKFQSIQNESKSVLARNGPDKVANNSQMYSRTTSVNKQLMSLDLKANAGVFSPQRNQPSEKGTKETMSID